MSKSRLDIGSLNRTALAAALLLSLAGCDTISGWTGGSGGSVPPTADPILLRQAEDRASLAQKSLEEANDMIAQGQKEQTDGQAMMLEGNRKVAVGTQLKSDAEQRLAVSAREVQEKRAAVDSMRSSDETGSVPAPQPNPRPYQ